MEKFNVYDTVKCINAKVLPNNEVGPNLIEGQEYPVKEIILDSAGNQHLDVGLISKLTYIRSYETKEELPNGDKIHWCHPSRFELTARSYGEYDTKFQED